MRALARTGVTAGKILCGLLLAFGDTLVLLLLAAMLAACIGSAFGWWQA